MPLTFRAKGVSLSTATNWAFNWVVGQMTPYLQDVIEWRLYFMLSFFCLCSFILVYFTYPETKGVPLEEMDIVFREGGEHKQTRYSSDEGRASYAPLREDHDHDHDDHYDEHDGEDYEMIERNLGRES